MSVLVAAEHVSRIYRNDGTSQAAIADFSLMAAEGEFVALMGPSGCGKSTLLNILGGIDRPDGGEVRVAGVRIDQLSETQLALFRRRHVGIVFQFFNLIHNLDARDNIELPGFLAGFSANDVHKRASELMEMLGIGDLARKMPGRLSGGQRQRVAIARALINRPALLLADEPTGALDQESGQAVLRLFRQLHARGQTILMVTHDPKVAGHAQRILMMQDGRLVDEIRPTGSLPTGLLGLRARAVE